MRRVLTTFEERVGGVPFLGCQSYSIADIATFPWARGVGAFLGKPAEADYPKLMAWVATINSRAGGLSVRSIFQTFLSGAFG